MNATKLIGLTTALGVAMTAAATQFAGVFPGSTDFEGVTLPDSYTTAANGAAIVAGNPDVANRPTNFVYAATRASVLSTEEADGTVLRNLKANGDAAALADGTAIYADLLFKASAAVPTDGAPPQVETGDQILIYLKDEGSATNLCVFAYGNVIDGEIDSFAEEGEGLPFVLDAPVAVGSWHRLIVEANNDVTTKPGDESTDPGFKIYLDGTLCTTAAGHDAFLSLTGDGTTYGTVSSIGFRGAGFVDDLVLSTNDPDQDLLDWATYLGAAVDGAYQIDDEADLFALREGMANGVATANTTFKLTADIALTTPWPGIGTYDNTTNADAFEGTFDGAGHRISNVVFANASFNNYRGFFNQVYNATIKDLTIQWAGWEAGITGEYGGAALVGCANNSTLQRLTAEGTIASGAHNNAGIVVRASGLTSPTTISCCTNKMAITGNYTKVAGICALTQAGTSTVTFDACVNEGAITAATAAGLANAGRDGLAGILAYAANGDGKTIINNCVNAGTINGASGFSGSNNGYTGAKAGQLLGWAYNSVSLTGANTVKDDYLAVGAYSSGKTTGQNFATVSGTTATMVADANVAAGATQYKAMTEKAAFTFTAAGTLIVDEALKAATVTSAVANYHVVKATSGTVTTYSLAIDQYTVSWDADGGTLSGDGYTSGLVDYGTAIVPPTATKADDAQYTYTFVEWMPALDKTVTSNVTYTAIYNAESLAPALPEWASEADAEKFGTWKETHSVSDTSTDYSAQYLMNVAPTATVVLKIESINVTAEGTQIVVGATANGSSEIDMDAINGVLNVTVSQSLADLATAAKKSIPAGNLGWDNHKAVITIPATDGTFVKASVDYTAGSTGLTPVPTSGE